MTQPRHALLCGAPSPWSNVRRSASRRQPATLLSPSPASYRPHLSALRAHRYVSQQNFDAHWISTQAKDAMNSVGARDRLGIVATMTRSSPESHRSSATGRSKRFWSSCSSPPATAGRESDGVSSTRRSLAPQASASTSSPAPTPSTNHSASERSLGSACTATLQSLRLAEPLLGLDLSPSPSHKTRMSPPVKDR
jgi:hypothetical protein